MPSLSEVPNDVTMLLPIIWSYAITLQTRSMCIIYCLARFQQFLLLIFWKFDMERRVATSYRCCFVPQCPNTSKNQPEKVFVCVPKTMDVRKKWFTVANRLDKPNNSNYFCCEDHFDVSILNWTNKSVVLRLRDRMKFLTGHINFYCTIVMKIELKIRVK